MNIVLAGPFLWMVKIFVFETLGRLSKLRYTKLAEHIYIINMDIFRYNPMKQSGKLVSLIIRVFI